MQKVLIIGLAKVHSRADCIEWDVSALPNLVDYHLIIVNVRSLSNEILKKISYDRLKELRTLLSRFLWSKGRLVILTDLPRSVQRPKNYPEQVTNYDWCPIQFGIEEESGDTIEILTEDFPKFFSFFKKWSSYFYMPESCLSNEVTAVIGSTYDFKYSFPSKVFIKNRYNKMLAGSYVLHVCPNHDLHRGEKHKGMALGEITLLPFIQDIDPEKSVSAILEDLMGFPQASLPPEWLGKVRMPLVDDYISEIESHQKSIDDLQAQILKIQEKVSDIEQYKKLLYADGTELENIFSKCLQKLGGEVIPSKYSNEEYILEYQGKEHPVEAKGVSKSIALTHVRQLADYLLKYEEENESQTIGILFGNPYKNISIDLRTSEQCPPFPDNVVRRSKDIGISLVHSMEFFKVFCRSLEDPRLASKILDRIVTTRGVVSFSGI